MLNLLSTVEIFKGIPREALAQLASSGIRRTFSAGDVLIQQGPVNDRMYVIVSGMVEATNTHQVLVEPVVAANLGPGDVAGVRGLLDQDPCTVTMTATQETNAIELDDLALAGVLLRYPSDTLYLLKMLSSRMGSMQELAASFEKRPFT